MQGLWSRFDWLGAWRPSRWKFAVPQSLAARDCCWPRLLLDTDEVDEAFPLSLSFVLPAALGAGPLFILFIITLGHCFLSLFCVLQVGSFNYSDFLYLAWCYCYIWRHILRSMSDTFGLPDGKGLILRTPYSSNEANGVIVSISASTLVMVYGASWRRIGVGRDFVYFFDSSVFSSRCYLGMRLLFLCAGGSSNHPTLNKVVRFQYQKITGQKFICSHACRCIFDISVGVWCLARYVWSRAFWSLSEMGSH